MAIMIDIADKETSQRVQLTATPKVIGRSKEALVQTVDPHISGKHLSVHLAKDGRTIMKDLDSTNGTYLNGALISEAYLHIDDVIQIGNVKISLVKEAMNPKEKRLHTRDFERTKITFVKTNENASAKKLGVDKALEATKNHRKRIQLEK